MTEKGPVGGGDTAPKTREQQEAQILAEARGALEYFKGSTSFLLVEEPETDGVMVVPSNFDPRGDGYLRDRMELAKHSGREVTREFLEDIVGNGRL